MEVGEHAQNMRELMKCMVEQLVDAPEDVEVAVDVDGRNIYLDVAVRPADRRFVIGRKGDTVRALQTLLSTASSRAGVAYRLRVVEEGKR